MKKPISSFTDKGELTKLMANARRLGNEQVYNDAFRRRSELEGANIEDPLHSRFMEVLGAYEGLLREKHGRNQAAGRTRQKMARSGIEQCLIDWSLATKESEAFQLLSERGMLELTGEHVVTQFPDRFDARVVEAAKARLERYS
ncbi:MAG: hypothetical protein M3Q15_03005 [Pseudomonadota bacterium]|nr:hypothetical protein [Pseudomonadota bacterium]